MRVLLLGGGGQIGWELNQLLAPVTELTAPDRAQAELSQPQRLREVLRSRRPQVVINAAAYTAVDAAEHDETGARAVNAVAPGVLGEEVARLDALLVHYSTDYVFDGTANVPYREDDPPRPLSAYGRSKLAGEEAVRASGCRHLILRTSWIYAARGKNFLLTMLRLAKERDDLRVVSDQLGAPTSARAVAEATADLVGREHGRGGTYHMTCGGHTSWHGFARRIVQHGAALGLCRDVPVCAITSAEFPTVARRPAYSVLDNGRLMLEFGIRLPDWDEALLRCLREFAQRR